MRFAKAHWTLFSGLGRVSVSDQAKSIQERLVADDIMRDCEILFASLV